jgi:hypothetical protein
VVYFAFSIVNFQAGADAIPFIPFAALFTALFIVDLSGLKRAPDMVKLLPGIIAVFVCVVAVVRGAGYRPSQGMIKSQDTAFRPILQLLGPGERIYVHGTTEILVLLNIPNANPYLLLDGGADDFIASAKPGGFADVIAEIDGQRPKLVVISRLKAVRRRDEIEAWVRENYEPVRPFGYGELYIRKADR